MDIVLLNMKRMLVQLQIHSGEKDSENGSNFDTQKYYFFSQKLLLVDF